MHFRRLSLAARSTPSDPQADVSVARQDLRAAARDGEEGARRGWRAVQTREGREDVERDARDGWERTKGRVEQKVVDEEERHRNNPIDRRSAIFKSQLSQQQQQQEQVTVARSLSNRHRYEPSPEQERLHEQLEHDRENARRHHGFGFGIHGISKKQWQQNVRDDFHQEGALFQQAHHDQPLFHFSMHRGHPHDSPVATPPAPPPVVEAHSLSHSRRRRGTRNAIDEAVEQHHDNRAAEVAGGLLVAGAAAVGVAYLDNRVRRQEADERAGAPALSVRKARIYRR